MNMRAITYIVERIGTNSFHICLSVHLCLFLLFMVYTFKWNLVTEKPLS